MKHQKIVGIDEAGRGPFIGPLVVCGVLFSHENLLKLRAIGVRDSKMLTRKKREVLYDKISSLADKITFRIIEAKEIDLKRKKGITLNFIEAIAFASIIKELKPDQVYMDAVDVNAERFGKLMVELSSLSNRCDFISKHKADSIFPVVAAASIIAKVKRDQIIKSFQKMYGDFGTGYPTDRKSILFIRKIIQNNEPLPSIIRQTWKTVENILSEEK